MASDSDSNFDPRRRLCPDGSCVGIMGADGKCTVCGLNDSGEAGSPGPDLGMDEDSDAMDDASVEPGSEGQSPGQTSGQNSGQSSGQTSEFDPNRRLCSDDTCVGVIGEDNRCRLCGKSAAP